MSDIPPSQPPADKPGKTLTLPGSGPAIIRKPPERTAPGRTPRAKPAAPSEAAAPGSEAEDGPLHFGKLVRISGLPAVTALFKQAPNVVERLFFESRFKLDVKYFCHLMAEKRKPYRMVDADELARVAGTVLHGGVVAIARPRPVPEFEPVAAATWAAAGEPLFLLDGIGNPHNLGAIVRSLAFFGHKNLVISDHPAQAMPSDASYRIAEGGMEYVRIHRAERFTRMLKRLKPHYRVVGTALGEGRPLEELGRDQPVAIILGNEERGLDPATLAVCDEVVNIPGSGHVQSLNVAATAAILGYELSRRRSPPEE